MANYGNLKGDINAYIRANGTQAITGPVLNSILTAMVNTLGDGYRFKGFAVPAGNPGSLDDRVFFLAGAAGTYTNYGGFTLDGETMHILTYDISWNNIDTGVPMEAAMAAVYAKQDGIYRLMTVGAALNLVGHGSVPAEFIFRTSGGNKDIGTGAAAFKLIKGKSIVWNQSARAANSSDEVYGITRTRVSDVCLHYSGESTYSTIFTATLNVPVISGHKYYLATNGIPSTCRISMSNIIGDSSAIYTAQSDNASFVFGVHIPSGVSIDADVYVVAIDLTLMFGAGNEPSTVAEFEALYPLPYYAYNAGTIINNDAVALETTGFNLYDNTTGKAQLLGGQSNGYQITGTYTSLSFTGVSGETSTITPDANGKFNVTENGELTVTGGNATDTCVHLVWSGYRNGEYEPYELHTATLGLNSFMVTDGENEITVNGLKSNGSDYDEVNPATRKYVKRVGARAYESGDESDATVTTDGTTTHYTLETPVEYDLVDDFPVSYYVNDFGTERAVAPSGATLPSAPFVEEVQYAMNAVDTLRRLSQNYISKDSMDNVLTALVTAGLLASYTLTYDADADEYTCAVTLPETPADADSE